MHEQARNGLRMSALSLVSKSEGSDIMNKVKGRKAGKKLRLIMAFFLSLGLAFGSFMLDDGLASTVLAKTNYNCGSFTFLDADDHYEVDGQSFYNYSEFYEYLYVTYDFDLSRVDASIPQYGNTDITAIQAAIRESKARQWADNRGYLFFSTFSEAVEYLTNYTANTCWIESGGGVVAPCDDYNQIVCSNYESGIVASGLYSSFSSFAFQSSGYAGTIANAEGYAYTECNRSIREGHYADFTEAMYEAASSKADEIAAMYGGGSTYDKVRNVYYYLCNNISYDQSSAEGDIYDALITGCSVCAGYAGAFQLIMQKMGIESYICTGYVNGRAHAWNAVNLDGTYYYVDATFGDPIDGSVTDQYLLFGTNIRSNIWPGVLPIASESYNNASYSYNVGYNDSGNIVVYDNNTGSQLSEDESINVINNDSESQTAASGSNNTAGNEAGNASNANSADSATEIAAAETTADSDSSSDAKTDTATATTAQNSTTSAAASSKTTASASNISNSTGNADLSLSNEDGENNANSKSSVTLIVIIAVCALLVIAASVAIVIGVLRSKRKNKIDES